MASVCGGRVLTAPELDDMGDHGVMVSRGARGCGDHVGCEWVGDLIPDLRDPATLGCVLALVREAWSDASGGPVPVTAADRGCTSGGPPVWFVVWSHGPCGDPFNRESPTEAHALVAALESAP